MMITITAMNARDMGMITTPMTRVIWYPPVLDVRLMSLNRKWRIDPVSDIVLLKGAEDESGATVIRQWL